MKDKIRLPFSVQGLFAPGNLYLSKLVKFKNEDKPPVNTPPFADNFVFLISLVIAECCSPDMSMESTDSAKDELQRQALTMTRN